MPRGGRIDKRGMRVECEPVALSFVRKIGGTRACVGSGRWHRRFHLCHRAQAEMPVPLTEMPVPLNTIALLDSALRTQDLAHSTQHLFPIGLTLARSSLGTIKTTVNAAKFDSMTTKA